MRTDEPVLPAPDNPAQTPPPAPNPAPPAKTPVGIRQKSLSMTVILVAIVVSLVAVMLLSCVLVFSSRYEKATVQTAKTSSSQAVTQAVSTVSSYTGDMNEVMELLISAMGSETTDQEEFLSAFLKMRPDVIAVTSYDGEGNLLQCWRITHSNPLPTTRWPGKLSPAGNCSITASY